MFEKTVIIFIFVVNCFLLGKSTAVIYRNVADIESLYAEKFIDNRPLKDFCHLSKEQKLAMCDEILSDINNDDKDVHSILRSAIYLNKAAAYYMPMNCIQNELTFLSRTQINRSNSDENIMQAMLPCYGRGEPMRTNWNIDDNYDLLYFSVGPEPNSVFVYRHLKSIDKYALYVLIKEVNFLNLTKLKITWDDVREELNSLNVLSFNNYGDDVEMNYIREIVMKETHVNDPVCDLEKEHKILLCKYIIYENMVLKDNLEYVFYEKLFDNHSTDCEEKLINPRPFQINVEEMKHKMYPCYGFQPKNADDVEPKFYLSGGYRPNSVLIYALYPSERSNKFDYVQIYSFAENVRVSYMPYIEQVNEPLKESEKKDEAEYLTMFETIKTYFGMC